MQTYVFLDESGDLGFNSKKGTSLNFIITVLITRKPNLIEKAVKKTLRWVKHRHRKHSGCLHAYREDVPTRMRLLHALAGMDCTVMVIRLNKRKVWTRLQDEKTVLYNFVTNILLDRLMKSGLPRGDSQVELVAAKRETNKFLNLNFKDYLQRQVQHNHQIQLHISILTPHEHKALQATDMLSWSVFRRLESGDERYYEIVKHLISESPLFT